MDLRSQRGHDGRRRLPGILVTWKEKAMLIGFLAGCLATYLVYISTH